MSQPTPKRLDPLESAANDVLPPEEQAKADAEHATTGWSAYDVWRTRVFAPKESDPKTGEKIGQIMGYNGRRGNS